MLLDKGNNMSELSFISVWDLVLSKTIFYNCCSHLKMSDLKTAKTAKYYEKNTIASLLIL
jgi:hypothetical protein